MAGKNCVQNLFSETTDKNVNVIEHPLNAPRTKLSPIRPVVHCPHTPPPQTTATTFAAPKELHSSVLHAPRANSHPLNKHSLRPHGHHHHRRWTETIVSKVGS